VNGDIGVELCQPRDGDGCSRGSDVLLSKEELSSEVCDGDRVGVKESDGFDSGKSDVLGCRGGKGKKRARQRWEEEVQRSARSRRGKTRKEGGGRLTNLNTKTLSSDDENVGKSHLLHGWGRRGGGRRGEGEQEISVSLGVFSLFSLLRI